MLVTTIYLLGVIATFLVTVSLRISTFLFRFFRRRLLFLVAKYVLYPVLIRRTFFSPPITRWFFLLSTLYLAATLTCTFLGASSKLEIASRAGVLSTINLVPLIMFRTLSSIADIIGIPLHISHIIHGSVASMVLLQTLLHVIMQLQQTTFDLRNSVHLWGMVVRTYRPYSGLY